jgi:hypothetical protein
VCVWGDARRLCLGIVENDLGDKITAGRKINVGREAAEQTSNNMWSCSEYLPVCITGLERRKLGIFQM